MLSICMIVKNEEDSLRGCLSKIPSFVDEIVIVDTGSMDNTKKIAEEFTDKIFDFVWCDDFSKARNFSISKASNDWVLVLDADEYIVQFTEKTIKQFICNKINEKRIGRIQRKNIMNDNELTKNYTDRINRLFNKNFFYYMGTIHEQLVLKENKPFESEWVDITIEHIGYMREVLTRTNKLNRNIELLNKAIKINPMDPYLYYQLAKSYYMFRNYKEAIICFDKAFNFELDYRLEYVTDLIETYGYALINNKQYNEGIKLEQYYDVYKHNSDFNFLLALIYMNNGFFSEAVNLFIQCTKFTYSKVEGVTSFLAYYNIGVIYEVLKIKDQAVKYYELCKEYEPALTRLSVINCK